MIAISTSDSQAATSDYRAFRASDDPRRPPDLAGVSESEFGAPLEQFVFDGQRVSRSMLNYMRMLTLLKRRVDTGPIGRVLEIGGGYGSLGEILLRASDGDYFYVDVDIPPVGFVATRYLQEVFGKHAVASYETTREMDNRRMEWAMGDLIHNRPALSRWHPDFKDAFEAFMKD